MSERAPDRSPPWWNARAWAGWATDRLAKALRRGGDYPPPPSAATSSDRAFAAAITRDELLLEYQPKLHLRQQRIVSLEALVRWQHPEQGRLYPGSFIPAVEETGDIVALTRWVIDRAIVDQRRLAAAGHDLPVFVNIAAKLLADDDFVTTASENIRASGAGIGLEITETSVIRDPGAAIANLQRVADMGIPVAIDDYGAGLSSLLYLKQLPACELKIDKLFITELTSSNRDPLIVRSTIDLAHAMEMEVVAEGVETQASLALLSIMGCDMAQGYWISRPLELPAMLEFLNGASDGERWRDASARFSPLAFPKRA